MGDGLMVQIDKSFIHKHEAKALSDLAQDMENMLLFGSKRTKIWKMQEDANRIVTTFIQNGKITIHEMTRLKKLIDSEDEENINLALHILNTK